MAGSNAGFDPAEFRTNIRAAMEMGLPTDPAERVTFRWKAVKVFNSATDHSGDPYDFSATPDVVTTHPDVQVPAAVEFFAIRTSSEGGTAVGHFDTPRAVITVLDVDYPSVEGADEVVLGGNTYKINYVAPPLGLFEVTVYQIHCTAGDES